MKKKHKSSKIDALKNGHKINYNNINSFKIGGIGKITLFLLFSGIMIIGRVIPLLFRLLFTFITLFFEIVGFMFLFTAIGVLGIVLFFALDFIVLRLLMKLFLI